MMKTNSDNRSKISDGIIYFDNAATSWPKPSCVLDAMRRFAEEVGANPGRSAHRLSIEAARIVFDARELLSRLFNAPSPERIVFGLNATEAINLALKGILRPGDHAITTGMEHNSVMRPLRALESKGVELSIVRCSASGALYPDDVEKTIRPNTKLVIINHASNVVGTILPVRDIGRICREKNLILLADCAQTAGCIPIDMKADFIDLLAFTGHKGLLGPQGVGGLAIGERIDTASIEPLKQGGTGSGSEYETQPDFLPDVFESGTPNTIGIAGLAAGAGYVLAETVEKICERERALVSRLIEKLFEITRLKLVGGADPANRVATVSFNIEGIDPSEVGLRLDEEYGIMSRVGLHCAPAAHRTLGTFPGGAVRFSLGCFSTVEEIDFAAAALEKIAGIG
jgi:cysteine desulfurase / selenocysteine lyase